MAFAHQTSIREELEEQVEYWRLRAETAEAKLGIDPAPIAPAKNWDMPVSPLTLSQTRVMRLLAKGPMTSRQMADVMVDYSRAEFADDVVKVMLCKCRKLLPENIAPNKANKHFAPHTVPDISALRAFLGETDTPDIRRVA